MKIINSEDRYIIYNDHVKSYDQLPAGSYTICFNKLMGFYLEKHSDIKSNEEKIYGKHEEKVEKVLNSFDLFNRNLGVILSGDKGIGKSLFARLLAEKSIEKNIPLIIADCYYPGMATFIESIKQRTVILFDEFDKTFAVGKDEDNNPQTEFLPLFDGLSEGKKLFVITCNDIKKLNSYLLNRPGRFHYHFRFKYPTAAEVIEYLTDKLDPKYHDEINKVVSFSQIVELNYDCLRAIAFELNLGNKFEDIMQDLNIINCEEKRYEIMAYFKNGEIMKTNNIIIDLFEKQFLNVYMYTLEGENLCDISFNTGDMIYDKEHRHYFVKPEKVKINYMEYTEGTKEEKQKEDIKRAGLEYLKIKRKSEKPLHYLL